MKIIADEAHAAGIKEAQEIIEKLEFTASIFKEL